jgi:hypothetical protein
MHKLLDGHDCTSTQWRGWGGIKNGDLIRLAEKEFDIFITSDQNLRYQQNLAGRCLAILELSTNDLPCRSPPRSPGVHAHEALLLQPGAGIRKLRS